MITPFDIENKEFGKSMRGYNIEEVDRFLDDINLDYEKLIEDNKQLKAKVESLNKELEETKKSENSVLNTLESAKHLMSDISASAEKRAEIILKNAKLDAEVLQRDAKESIGKLAEEGEELKKKVARYRNRYRQLLEDELNELEGSSANLFAELEKDFIPASLISDNESRVSGISETKVIDQVDDEEVKTVSQPMDDDVKPAKKVGTEKSAMDMLMEDFKKKPAFDDKSKTRVINLKEEL